MGKFRARSDLNASEAAFAGLMARHGPMVLGVCRRALRNPDDVADAFQATFLILVRKADTVRVEDSLGRWLYGVSRRVSVRAKRRSSTQVEPAGPRNRVRGAPGRGYALQNELRDVLDKEIGRLPEKFRSAVVLCEKPVRIQPATSNPAQPPEMQTRLSGIERKLVDVLKALEDLKRETRK